MYFYVFGLQVETFGAMAKTEKIAFILEQVCASCIFVCVFSLFVACTLSLGNVFEIKQRNWMLKMSLICN
jgi:hypothetical protein